MIHLYMGEGKGKTTAAIGLCIRAAGSGMQVIFSQFMKGNDTGELHVLAALPNVKILRSEKPFGFYKTLSDSQKAALTGIHNALLDQIWEAVRGQTCDMVILDEITYPVTFGLLDVSRLEGLLAAPDAPEIVLTGRAPADFMLECADYITEMRAVRHPFEKGIVARKGIEY